jgi:hypothetical protein
MLDGYMVNGPDSDFKTETLDLLGIPRDKRFFTGAATHFQCETLLDKHGFQPVFCEGLSFQRKGELFFAAEAVVAAHGAGLTHLDFCRPGTKVVEFFSPGYVNNVFWSLANAAALDYGCVLGEGQRPPVGLEVRLLFRGRASLTTVGSPVYARVKTGLRQACGHHHSSPLRIECGK